MIIHARLSLNGCCLLPSLCSKVEIAHQPNWSTEPENFNMNKSNRLKSSNDVKRKNFEDVGDI
jgi:hypothetical protein